MVVRPEMKAAITAVIKATRKALRGRKEEGAYEGPESPRGQEASPRTPSLLQRKETKMEVTEKKESHLIEKAKSVRGLERAKSQRPDRKTEVRFSLLSHSFPL